MFMKQNVFMIWPGADFGQCIGWLATPSYKEKNFLKKVENNCEYHGRNKHSGQVPYHNFFFVPLVVLPRTGFNQILLTLQDQIL